jgi:molecular chaperone DnaK (HSP70)
VSEPEAAGIYSLSAMNVKDVRKDDNIITFDAGGGTVDIISLLSMN